MAELTSGPLHPQRDFRHTELTFMKIKLLHSAGPGGFNRILWPESLMPGTVYGLQATMVPNKKRGIDFTQQLIGTAFFIAPGVAISAWHVLKDFLPETSNGAYQNAPMPVEFQLLSPIDQKSGFVWPVHSFSVGSDSAGGSDVTAIGCHLSGPQPNLSIHPFLTISDRFPVKGEKLHILGLKEPSKRISHNAPILLEMYESVGYVTDLFPNGRGNMPVGPCFALSTGATGGMSGSPVFDDNGIVIGILSTSVDDRDIGYSIVSSIAPVLDHTINQTWRYQPKNGVKVRDLL